MGILFPFIEIFEKRSPGHEKDPNLETATFATRSCVTNKMHHNLYAYSYKCYTYNDAILLSVINSRIMRRSQILCL